VIPFVPLLVAVVALWFVFFMVSTVCLHIVIWSWWYSRGRDVLFVYSESPIWHNYIERHILPDLGERAVVLNWSQRTRWRLSLARLAFYRFGGWRAFNPMAVVFRPFRRSRTFRFLQPLPPVSLALGMSPPLRHRTGRLTRATTFRFKGCPPRPSVLVVTGETFKQEVGEAVRAFEKYVVCLEKAPGDCLGSLNSLVDKAIKAYENRGPNLRHGIALDRHLTVILSQSDSERPLCAIYFNLFTPYGRKPAAKTGGAAEKPKE